MTALAAYEAGLRIGGGCWNSWRGSRLLVLDSTCGRHVAVLGSARP
jgi:hypothetical protein